MKFKLSKIIPQNTKFDLNQQEYKNSLKKLTKKINIINPNLITTWFNVIRLKYHKILKKLYKKNKLEENKELLLSYFSKSAFYNVLKDYNIDDDLIMLFKIFIKMKYSENIFSKLKNHINQTQQKLNSNLN